MPTKHKTSSGKQATKKLKPLGRSDATGAFILKPVATKRATISFSDADFAVRTVSSHKKK
jgi:hypothetical protein